MAFRIAIASGKGGTGKTTVSVNLYHFIQKWIGERIQLVDCDVEEPNDVLFFNNTIVEKEDEIMQLIPVIDNNACTFCRKCSEYCEFNAIVVIPPIKFAEVNADLCHSCGACSVACKYSAITEKPEPVGKVTCYSAGKGNGLLEGKLKIGSAMQTFLIKELKNRVTEEAEIILYDAPPGTSCPVVETIADTDYVILVTEPTPFGLYDLKLTIELLRNVNKHFGVIVNKAGLGNNEVYDYLETEGIELLGNIPFIQEYAERYATGKLMDSIPEDIGIQFEQISLKLKRKKTAYERNNDLKR